MNYSEIKRRFANPADKAFYNHRYAIYNEYGVIAIVYADHVSEAFHIAADNGKLDCQAMSPDDYSEYESNGWSDSYMLLGNASEPFWCEYLGITDITSNNDSDPTPNEESEPLPTWNDYAKTVTPR